MLSIKTITQKLIDCDLGKTSMSEYVRKAYEQQIDTNSVEIEKLEARKEKLLAIYQPRELSPYDIEDWFSELRTYNINSFEDRQHIISKYVKQVFVYDDYMEVTIYQPNEIGVIEEADTTLACAKTYFDFRNEHSDAELPDLTSEETQKTIDKILNDDDDDHDPDGPGGAPIPQERANITMTKKSTRPYNKKKSQTPENSAEEERSSLAVSGEPAIDNPNTFVKADVFGFVFYLK